MFFYSQIFVPLSLILQSYVLCSINIREIRSSLNPLFRVRIAFKDPFQPIDPVPFLYAGSKVVPSTASHCLGISYTHSSKSIYTGARTGDPPLPNNQESAAIPGVDRAPSRPRPLITLYIIRDNPNSDSEHSQTASPNSTTVCFMRRTVLFVFKYLSLDLDPVIVSPIFNKYS